MKDVKPVSPEFLELKLLEEKKRDAYLLKKLGPEGLWKWQQAAISDLARLRPELAKRHESPAQKRS